MNMHDPSNNNCPRNSDPRNESCACSLQDKNSLIDYVEECAETSKDEMTKAAHEFNNDPSQQLVIIQVEVVRALYCLSRVIAQVADEARSEDA